jgi:polar amino acid transport system substrate-binding protein
MKRRNEMKKLLVLMMLFTVTILSGCGKTSEYLEEGYLVAATSPDYAPYEFIDSSKTGIDKFVGADIELMKYIAEELGLTLKIEEMDFEACLTAIQGRKVDIAISGFSWTPKREKYYELSNSYYDEGDGIQKVLIRTNDADKFKTLNDLNKAEVKIAAQTGSIQDELVDTQLKNATKQNLDNLDMALSLLLEGKVDAIAISEHAGDIRIENNSALAFLGENFDVPTVGNVVVVKKGNTGLITKINEIIEEVKANGLYDQWIIEAKAYANAMGEDIGE